MDGLTDCTLRHGPNLGGPTILQHLDKEHLAALKSAAVACSPRHICPG